MKKSINSITNEILNLFNEKEIDKIAYKVGFTKRKGKVTPLKFLALCIFYSEDILNNTLASISTTLKIEYGIDISERGINERFNEQAVNFLKYFLMVLIKTKLPTNRFDQCYFNKIRIADSTIIKLPTCFYNDYPGAGPKSGKDLDKRFSAVKIQNEFDLLTGQILDITVEEGNRNDALYLQQITPKVEEKDLCLRDLGYHKISDLVQIDRNKGLFISKIKLSSAIYSKDIKVNTVTGEIIPCKLEKERRVYLEPLLNKLKPGDTLSVNNVLFGSKEKFPCRLIITKLPEKFKSIKEKNILDNLKRKRLKSSIHSEKNLDIVTYISNIQEDKLNSKDAYHIYSLRWQIEILFKCWKSIFKIDQNKSMKVERFRCGLFGTLLSVALANNIYNEIKTETYSKEAKALSELKGFRLIKDYFGLLKNSIFKGRLSIKKTIKEISDELIKKCIKAKKGTNMLSESKVLLVTK